MTNETLDIDGNTWCIMPYDICLADPRCTASFGRTIKEVKEKYPSELRGNVTGKLANELEPGKRDGFVGIDCGETNISFVGYKHNQKVMLVEYTTGKNYHYLDVPQDVWQQILVAESKGAALNRLVKGNFRYHCVNGD